MQSFPSNFRGKWSQIVRKREKSHPEQQQQHPPREIPSIYFAYHSTETISPIDFSLRISTKFPLSTNSSSNTEGSKKKRWNFSAFYPVCSCVCVCDLLGVERVRIADSKKKTVSSFRPRPARKRVTTQHLAAPILRPSSGSQLISISLYCLGPKCWCNRRKSRDSIAFRCSVPNQGILLFLFYFSGMTKNRKVGVPEMSPSLRKRIKRERPCWKDNDPVAFPIWLLTIPLNKHQVISFYKRSSSY